MFSQPLVDSPSLHPSIMSAILKAHVTGPFFYLDNALIVKGIYFAKLKNSYLRSKGFAAGDRFREKSHCLLEQPLVCYFPSGDLLP